MSERGGSVLFRMGVVFGGNPEGCSILLNTDVVSASDKEGGLRFNRSNAGGRLSNIPIGGSDRSNAGGRLSKILN